MTYLYFELNEPDNRQREYDALLAKYADACLACTQFVLRALELMSVSSSDKDNHFPGVVFLLGRHVAEELDAVSVLAMKGSAQPCKLHLRSAFEASLGIFYILEERSEERALSFHVAEIHKRIQLNKRLDPSTDEGRQLRKQVEDDSIGSETLAKLPQTDLGGMVARFEARLRTKPYDAIEHEWQRTAKKMKKKRPSWFSLFDGPATIRDLAYRMKKGFWYEFQYNDWSEAIHASSGLRQVARISDDASGDRKAVRPLRHPDGLRTHCDLASCIATELEQGIAKAFLGPVAKNVLHDFYMQDVRPRLVEIGKIAIKADWA